MKQFKIGLQLYSVREEMEKDMPGTLRKVKDMGYDYVEFAGYFNHSAEEVRALCDEIGLEIVSVHQKHDVFMKEPQEAVDYLKTLGVKYCAVPWVSRATWQENYAGLIEELSKTSDILKKADINLLYHNHEFELLDKIDGEFILDKMCNELGKDKIVPQLDVCWVHYAGQKPEEYIKKYAHMKVLHLKDFVCDNLGAGPVYELIDENGNAPKNRDRATDGFHFRPIGYGRQDIPAIMKAAEETDVEYVIVEQDNDFAEGCLGDAAKSRAYLASIGY